MDTLVSERVDITVNIREQSITATANWVFQLALRIVDRRGLRPDYLIAKRQIIENGLFAWLAEQTLEGLSIEIFAPDREEAIERFDFAFSYRAEADTTVRNPNMAQFDEFCRTLAQLPANAQYRILATTAPGACQVEGWYPGTFKPLRIERQETLSDHGFGLVGTTLVYRGGRQ